MRAKRRRFVALAFASHRRVSRIAASSVCAGCFMAILKAAQRAGSVRDFTAGLTALIAKTRGLFDPILPSHDVSAIKRSVGRIGCALEPMNRFKC